MRYTGDMSIPQPKVAVYFGEITLDSGEVVYYTAEEIAELYNVDDLDYLSVDLAQPEPFENGQDYMQYIHLKPLPNSRYYDAKQVNNIAGGPYYDEDFDGRRGGKWQVRPEYSSEGDTI